jgi:hypothetical protein
MAAVGSCEGRQDVLGKVTSVVMVAVVQSGRSALLFVMKLAGAYLGGYRV